MTICSKKMKTIRRGVEDTIKENRCSRENGRKRSKKLGRG
jgi:hypothetical protein